MKSLNDLIWKPETDDICSDKHLSNGIAIVDALCVDIPNPPVEPQGGVCFQPPTLPQAICTNIGGPMLITCSGIMGGSCGTPGTGCGPGEPPKNFQ